MTAGVSVAGLVQTGDVAGAGLTTAVAADELAVVLLPVLGNCVAIAWVCAGLVAGIDDVALQADRRIKNMGKIRLYPRISWTRRDGDFNFITLPINSRDSFPQFH